GERWQASAKPSPSVALDPVDGEALPRQDDALADRCAFAVMLARWFRRLARKESSFLQRRAKFSEGRSERPDVTSTVGSQEDQNKKNLNRKRNNNYETKIN